MKEGKNCNVFLSLIAARNKLSNIDILVNLKYCFPAVFDYLIYGTYEEVTTQLTLSAESRSAHRRLNAATALPLQ